MMRRLQCSLPMFQNLQLFTVLRTTPNLRKQCLNWLKQTCRHTGQKAHAHAKQEITKFMHSDDESVDT